MTSNTTTAPTADHAAHRITWPSMINGIWEMRRDLPQIARQLPIMANHDPARKWTVGQAFAKAAAAHPDRLFLRAAEVDWTYGECNRRANRWAAELSARGVVRGDVVAICAHNSPEVVIAMLAVVKLGAVAGMINYNQPGDALSHSFGLLAAANRAGPRATVVVLHDDATAAGLADVDAASATIEGLSFADLDAHADALAAADATVNADPAITQTLPASSPAYYIFTSGTTGWPKASIMSHSRWQSAMAGIGGAGIRLRSDDVMYVALPFYHNNALTISIASALSAGAALAIGKKFSASRFWDDVIANDATAFCYIGELCRYLLAQPAKATDRAHRVRLIAGNGLRPEIWEEFVERFGIGRVVELYAASESNIGFVNIFGQSKTAGFCPLPYAVVQADEETGQPIRDANGHVIRAPQGTAGLLLGQISDRARMDGYTDPAATETKIVRDAFKAGDAYFNTGDLVAEQGFRHIAFVDRLGDTFRWKGENVATTEVEAALNAIDGISASVVYGVAVPGADGKAGMAAVVVDDHFDPIALATQARARLPHYAVPLYLRIVDELTHTSTFKNVRVDLRKQGYTDVGGDQLYTLTEGGYARA
ncbi:long-chain-acyl-CoA synthetase [Gordonia asplenii]|uniref:long-chain-acyl-CoA synthetase n=1 Tax=Gordonia asplenii TaxID=2725283 RepID=UPI0028A6975F|nr:long-chain-acyl-CoA synthetase [Gordonia asplenii]